MSTSLFSIISYYYICTPISKYLSTYIVYYTGITPLLIPMTSNIIVKPIQLIIEYFIFNSNSKWIQIY